MTLPFRLESTFEKERKMLKIDSRCKLGALLSAVVLLGAQPALAETLTYDGFKWGSVTTTVSTNPPLDAPVTTSPSTGGFNVRIGSGTSIEAWCIDIWQWLNGSDYTFHSSILGLTEDSGKVTFTQAKIDDLSRLATEAHGSINDATSSAAFQAAIWEIAFESPGPYALNSGAFTTTAPSAVTQLATAWLNGLGSYSPGAYRIGAWTSPSQQDVLVIEPIPEPETLAMLLAGLALMVFAARRWKLHEAAAT